MTNPNFGLLYQGQYQGNALAPFVEGMQLGTAMRERRAEKAYTAGVNALLANPESMDPINSVAKYDGARALELLGTRKDMLDQRKDEAFGVAQGRYANALLGLGMPQQPTQSALQPAVMAADQRSASGSSLASGSPRMPRPIPYEPQNDADAAFAEAFAIDPMRAMTMRSDMRDNAVKNLDALDGAYDMAMGWLGSARDPQSYNAWLSRASRLFQPFGLDISQHVPPEYPGADGLEAIRMQGLTAKDQIEALRLQSRLDWDVENGRADNARADRNTESLIDNRAGRLAVSQQGADTAARREGRLASGGGKGGSRSSGTPKRQTATNPQTGETVEWNGKAWVPVQ